MSLMDEQIRVPERRVFRRADVSRPVEIELLAPSDRSPLAQIEGETVNIGCGGVAARIPGTLVPGSPCRIRILDQAGTTRTDEIEGQVRWTQTLANGSRVGIQFETQLGSMRMPRQDEDAREFPRELAQRVLVADDEPEIRRMLSRFLGDLGCDVETAADGDETLEALRRDRPDVLLLDLRMPGLDGLGVLERIRSENLEVGPIWAMSGYCSDREAEEAMHLGAADFINKPLDLQYLEWSLNMNQMAG
jgi:CheY-like chemotaxis protein